MAGGSKGSSSKAGAVTATSSRLGITSVTSSSVRQSLPASSTGLSSTGIPAESGRAVSHDLAMTFNL